MDQFLQELNYHADTSMLWGVSAVDGIVHAAFIPPQGQGGGSFMSGCLCHLQGAQPTQEPACLST